MAKAIKRGFYDVNFLVIPRERDEDISDNIQQTLSRLLGFDDSNNRFDLVKIDTDGRLLVSSSQTKTDSANNSQVAPTTSDITVLAANPDRKQYIIQNVGGVDVYLNFGATVVTGTDMLLAAGATFIDEIYQGTVTGKTISGTADLRVVEMD